MTDPIPLLAAGALFVRPALPQDVDRDAELAPGYDRFIAALTRRGWLDPRTAEHARRRAAA